MKIFLCELSLFLFHPNKKSINREIKWQYFFYTVLLYFAMSGVFVILIKKLDETFGLPPHKSFSFIQDNPWYLVLFLGLIIIPVFEELTFRLYLKYSPVNLSLSMGLLSYYVISIASKSGLYTLNQYMVLKLSITILLSITFYYLFTHPKISGTLNSFWEKNFPSILYFSILLFAFVHVRNLGEVTLKNLLLFPVIVFPQFILAAFTSFFRIKYGIIHAILIHSFINLIPITIMAIAFSL